MEIHLTFFLQVPPVFALDGSDPSKWDEQVRLPAEGVVQALAEGRQPELETANMVKDEEEVHRGKWKMIQCGRYYLNPLIPDYPLWACFILSLVLSHQASQLQGCRQYHHRHCHYHHYYYHHYHYFYYY